MAAEISLKNECPQGECCTVISTLGNRSFEHLRISNPGLISMIVGEDARIATLDIDEKKRNSSEIKWLPRGHGFSRPTFGLDPWSRKNDKKKFDIMRSGKLNIPESNLKWMLMHDYSDPNRPRPCLDARCLRRTRPDYIPVTVEKDARSDIPDIEMKKYQVHGEMALDEFMYLVMVWIGVSRGKPVYAFFRKSQFPKGALMSAIYHENVGEDGYLHMTYTGEDDFPGSFGCALQ